MLINLLMIQALVTLVLNQTHQAMLAQIESIQYNFPSFPSERLKTCLVENCKVQLLASTSERQIFSSVSTYCENGHCMQITQVFSEPSAILKGERHYYAIEVIDLPSS